MIGDAGGDAEGTPSRWSGARILELGMCEQDGAGGGGGGQARVLGSAVKSLCVLKEGSSCQGVYGSEHSPGWPLLPISLFGVHCCPQTKVGHSFIHSLTYS